MWKKIKIMALGVAVALLCVGLAFRPASADILEEVFKRIAYVDLEKVFQEYEKKKVLEKKLQAEGEVTRQELAKKREEIEKLKEEYKAQELLLSEEAKRERQEEIAKKSEALRELLDEVSKQMKEKEQKYTQEIVSDIMNKIKEIAEKEGYIFIFDKAALLYGAPPQDITKKIIDELNKEYEAER